MKTIVLSENRFILLKNYESKISLLAEKLYLENKTFCNSKLKAKYNFGLNTLTKELGCIIFFPVNFFENQVAYNFALSC